MNEMEILKWILIVLHIAGGGFSLLSGIISLSVKKGSKIHRLGGKIFTRAMAVCSLSGMGLAPLTGKWIFLAVGAFTLYMIITGQPDWFSKSVLFRTVIPVSGIFVSIGLLISLNVIFMVFGGIMGLFSAGDLLGRTTNPDYLARIRHHIGRIVGAYISAFTAFLVVNVHLSGNLSLVTWLGPTLAGTGFIFYWTRKYRQTPGKGHGIGV